ncbi:MAG: hypothetical protein JW909_02050 [Planctomycetes bacterium]|nr:hypothetical protein [Planctomycetota bacterium]
MVASGALGVRRTALCLLLLVPAVPLRAADLAVNAYVPFPVGSPRVMGMAGAFTGVGEGSESLIVNPASVARTSGFELGNAHLDYMVSVTEQDDDFQSDFGNVGAALLGKEAVLIAGLGLKSRFDRAEGGALGYGLNVLFENYYFTDGGGGEAEFNLTSPRFVFGWEFKDDQLFLSLSLDASSPKLTYLPPASASSVDVDYAAFGGLPLELALLYVPENSRFQFGARLKGPRGCAVEDASSLPPLDPFPYEVVYPGEWAFGFAWKIGDKCPEDRSEWFDSAMLSFDLRGVFPVDGTSGFERFRSVSPEEIVDGPLVQPALGFEVEVFSRAAWLWLGTYREPARYDDVDARQHVTGGFKFRLLKIKRLSFFLNFAYDKADRYDVFSASISTGITSF